MWPRDICIQTYRLTEYFDDHNVTPIGQKNESLLKGTQVPTHK